MRRLPLLACLLASVVLTACGETSDRAAEASALRVVGPFEVHSLDPILDGEIFTRLEVAETLVTADEEGLLAPGLATSWDSSDRDTVWTFELPADATFHDGSPVTAQAVVDSLDLAAQQEASPLAGVPVRAMRAEGERVVIELTSPYSLLPAVLTHYSAQVLAPAAYAEDGHVDEVIGTGPYRVDSVQLPAEVETVVFEDYRGERPEVEQVTFQAVSRPEQRAIMAASGQADVVFGLEPAGRERVEAADGVVMASSLQPRTILLKVNAEHPVLGDARVRRALSAALDREAMAQAVLREPELAATQLLPPSLGQWQADVEPLTHDEAAALSLFEDAGWTPGADGVLERDGEPLELTLTTYPDRPELPALATAIQASWRDVGVDLTVDVTNSSEIPAGHADGSLELGLLAKHFALVSDPLIDIDTVLAEGGGSDWGAMRWEDEDVRAALDALKSGLPEDEASRARETVVRTVQEQLPVIPVSWYRMNAAVTEDVDGFVIDPLETSWRLSSLSWS